MSTYTDAFREAVANWMKDNGVSYSNLAKLTGLMETTITKFITGQTKNVTLENYKIISRVIGYKGIK